MPKRKMHQCAWKCIFNSSACLQQFTEDSSSPNPCTQTEASLNYDPESLLAQLAMPRATTDLELDDAIVRAILGCLRHKTLSSPLSHDCFGLVRVEEFTRCVEKRFQHVDACRLRKRFQISIEELIELEKIEFRAGKVRALYGHSLHGVIVGEMKWPDSTLYHATRERHLDSIFEHGLRSQSRTWVHLTTNSQYADRILVNHECGGGAVLLSVKPTLLEDSDVTFRKPNSHVWLASRIPSFAIKVCDPNDHSELKA